MPHRESMLLPTPIFGSLGGNTISGSLYLGAKVIYSVNALTIWDNLAADF